MADGPIRRIDDDWDIFRGRHAAWIDRLPPGPLCSLPEPAVDRLARPYLGDPPIVADTRPERDLLELARRHFAIGVADGRPIAYPPLAPISPAIDPGQFSPAQLADLPWAAALRGPLERHVADARDARDRLGGYAGWLATEPPFLAEAGALRSRWEGVPRDSRPPLPLRRPLRSGLPELDAPFDALCARWGLLGMATWDLPDPQGPLLPVPGPLRGPLVPPNAVHLVLPFHYPLTGDDDLLRQIRALQRARADDLGVDPSAAGLPHHALYARILEVLHLEATIASRLGGSLPRGTLAPAVEAIAEAIGTSVDHVEKLRKMISAARRGRRDAVRELRPRPR